MAVAPVLIRELQVAARQRRTYWLRVVVGGGFVLLLGWIIWTHGSNKPSARQLFSILSWMTWGACLLAGAIGSADALSREKREATLGLLFLTRLRARDVALGKLVSASLVSVFAIGSILPLLSVPIMLGGVSYGEFFRVALSLLNTLFLACAVGLFCSAAGRDAFRTAGASLGILAFLLLLPLLGSTLEDDLGVSNAAAVTRLFSPGWQQSQASGWLAGANFWWSILSVHLLGHGFLLGGIFLTRRNWHEGGRASIKSPFSRAWQGLRRWNRSQSGSGQRRRARMLEGNPFVWLAHRERVAAAGFLVASVCVMVVGMWFFSVALARQSFGNQPLIGLAVVWLFMTVALHALLLVRIANLGSRRFGEDRASGALELILATPLSVSRILRGQWLALLRGCAGPMAVLVAMHASLVFLIAQSLMPTLHWTGNTGALVLQALSQFWHGAIAPNSAEQTIVIMLPILGAAILIAYWIALSWVSMWMGLVFRPARLAPWAALALVTVPPWLIFITLVHVLEDYTGFRPGSEHSFLFMLKILLAVQWVYQAGLTIWAWSALTGRFRQVAGDHAAPVIRWRMLLDRALLRRLALLFLVVATAFSAQLIAFYQLERWRGERSWSHARSIATSRGEDFRAQPIPVIPSWENLAEAPVFDDLHSAKNRPAVAGQLRLQQVTASGIPKGQWMAGQVGSWRRGTKTDLGARQTFFRDRSMVPVGSELADPGAEILLALEKVEPFLDGVIEAAQRPQASFLVRPGHRDDPDIHWDVVFNLVEVLNLRAVAALSLGDGSAALRDLEVALRLSESVRDDPRLRVGLLRQSTLDQCLNTVWEGLEGRGWSAPELARLSELLLAQQANLLSEVATVLRAEIFRRIELRDPTRTLDPMVPWWRAWRMHSPIYPVGWARRNQARLYLFYDQWLRGAIDAANGRLNLSPALEEAQQKQIGGLLLGTEAPHDSAYFSYLENVAQAQAGLNLAVMAGALERFFLDQSRYPESPVELLPGYLDCLPGDPWTGAPLFYRREGDRCLVYSVGQDGRDDNGNRHSDTTWGYSWNPRNRVSGQVQGN